MSNTNLANDVINGFKDLAKKYNFKATVDSSTGDLIFYAKNTDKEWTKWIYYNPTNNDVSLIGNTDQCNLWFCDTRKDLTPEKLIEFTADLNKVLNKLGDSVELSTLVDPEDWQEIADVYDAYEDPRYSGKQLKESKILESKETKFNTIMHWGPDDDGEITNVITSDTEIPDNIEETLVSKFGGLFHNDLNGGYWSYDIPLEDGKVLEFRDFVDDESTMYWELVDTKLTEDIDETSNESIDGEKSDTTSSDNSAEFELHEKWIAYLKSKIAENCNSDGFYEVYWNYDDEFDPASIQKIVSNAIETDSSLVAAADDYLWDLNSGESLDEYFIDDISKNIPEELEDYALDRDLLEDLEEAGYNGVDMNAQELLDKSDVKVNIIFATPSESNYDMSSIVDVFGSWKDPAYNYIVDNPEILDNAMTYLIHQQGHSLKEYYQCLLENPGGFGFDHKDTFIESCVNDCVNNTSNAMSGICCLTTLTPDELYELEKAMKTGTGNLEFSKDTYCGTVNIWAGSGGLSVNLEKPLIIPVSYIHTIQVEGGKNNNGYTVDEIFGLVGSCWDGKMTFTNSQPDLYKENKEELLNYIKTLIPEDEEGEE